MQCYITIPGNIFLIKLSAYQANNSVLSLGPSSPIIPLFIRDAAR